MHLVLSGEAAGQTTNPMPTPMGTGSCSGMLTTGTGMATLGGTTGLYAGPDDGPTIIQNPGVMFGRAECECRSRDLKLGIQLTPGMALPPATTGVAANMWLGISACDDSSRRTQNGTQCEQMLQNSPPANLSWDIKADKFTSSALFLTSIPAEALSNPKPVGTTMPWTYSCDIGSTQNRTVFVFVGDPTTPAVCSLPLTVNTTPPQPPTKVKLGSGDSALTVAWEIPPGTTGIEYYQVLCRKKGSPDTPVMSSEFLQNTPYWFSACVGGTLYRRPLPGLMQNMDSIKPVAGVTELPKSSAPAPDFPIDPKFICSGRVDANNTSLSTRVENLENFTDYEVMVVSIDRYGNPAASSVEPGRPLPTRHPLSDYCEANAGVCPSGFGCQLSASRAPAGLPAFGLLILGSVGLLSGQRRRHCKARAQRRAA